jgi:predicted phosphodiesterase
MGGRFMRVAIMSDIHGFDLALRTVLDDLTERGPFAEVIVAGDLALVGPAPRTAIDMLVESGATLLTGNSDRDLVEAALAEHRPADMAFALSAIGQKGVALLVSLPFSRRITPPGGQSPVDDLLVVHANPHDLDTKLKPEMSDGELRAVLGDAQAAVIAFGHHHMSFIREVDGMLLVDVAAVGNPKDGDLRCKYAVIAWDAIGKTWSAEIICLDYPVEATIAEMRQSGMPDAEAAIATLLRASYDSPADPGQ